jgi:hypothetical protein
MLIKRDINIGFTIFSACITPAIMIMKAAIIKAPGIFGVFEMLSLIINSLSMNLIQM